MLRRASAPTAKSIRGVRRAWDAPRPRLPIPGLEDTCARLLETVRPIATTEEMKEIEDLAADFAAGEGQELQKLLQQYDATDEYLPDRGYLRGSYVESFWDDMYLGARDSVSVYSNPFLTFAEDPVPARRSQARRAANLIYNSLLVMQLVDARALNVGPECPSQYRQLFRTTRIPRLGRDSLRTAHFSRHVTILHKGRFHELEVLTAAGEPKSEARIARALDHLLARHARDDAPSADVSTLTQLPRDDWARYRAALRDESPENAAALHKIGASILHVALEADQPRSQDEVVSTMLHGNGRGRWMDQSLSVVVFPDGGAGFSFEHSWGDGQTLLRWANEVYERSLSPTAPHVPVPGVADLALEAVEIPITVGDVARQGIAKAADHARMLASSVDAKARHFHHFGKDEMKRLGVSPDAFFQAATQRAYARVFGACGSTYESCSTKHFRHGRTETLRPVTAAAVAWATGDATAPDAADRLRAAAEQHVAVAKRSQQGLGVDRHLAGLAHAARVAGRPPHPLFSCAALQRMKRDVMSTSNCGSEHLEFFGFGPTNADCFGVGYMIQKSGVWYTVTSWNKETEQLSDAISDALREAREVLARD